MISTLLFYLLKKAWSLVLLMTKIFKWNLEKKFHALEHKFLFLVTYVHVLVHELFLIFFWKFLSWNASKFLFFFLNAWDLDVSCELLEKNWWFLVVFGLKLFLFLWWCIYWKRLSSLPLSQDLIKLRTQLQKVYSLQP